MISLPEIPKQILKCIEAYDLICKCNKPAGFSLENIVLVDHTARSNKQNTKQKNEVLNKKFENCTLSSILRYYNYKENSRILWKFTLTKQAS